MFKLWWTENGHLFKGDITMVQANVIYTGGFNDAFEKCNEIARETLKELKDD